MRFRCTNSGSALILAALLVCTLPAAAEAQQSRQQELQQRQEARRDVAGVRDSPAFTDSLLSVLSGVSLEAGAEKSTAKIRLAWKSGFAITVNAPFEEKAGESTFVDTLDGLGDTLNVGFAYARTLFPSLDSDYDYEGAQRAVCNAAKVPSEDPCTRTAVVANRPDLEGEFLAGAFPEGGAWYYSVEGKIGRDKAEYFDPVSTDKTNETNVSGSGGFAIGQIRLSSLWFVKVRYENKYSDQSKVTKCTPVEDSGVFENCTDLPLGAPGRKEGAVFSAGGRWFLRPFAVGASIGYDTAKEIFAVDVPVYFMKNSDGLFTGGVRFRWDEDNDFRASVFISAPLKLSI